MQPTRFFVAAAAAFFLPTTITARNLSANAAIIANEINPNYVNCKGSGWCQKGFPGYDGLLPVENMILAIDEHLAEHPSHADDWWYDWNQRPICHSNGEMEWICGVFQGASKAITKKYAAGNLGHVKLALEKLRDHGCERCGSVPFGPYNAWLTFNYMYAGCLQHPKVDEWYHGGLVCDPQQNVAETGYITA